MDIFFSVSETNQEQEQIRRANGLLSHPKLEERIDEKGSQSHSYMIAAAMATALLLSKSTGASIEMAIEAIGEDFVKDCLDTLTEWRGKGMEI